MSNLCMCTHDGSKYDLVVDLLENVMKVTFEQRTENNVIVHVLLSLVKVLSIAPLTVIYIVYKLAG